MRVSVFLAAALAVIVWVPALADEGPPDPISLDRQSPSVVLFGETPDNIYDLVTNIPMPPAIPAGWDVGGPGPLVHVWGQNYGLSPQDNNDGHSNGEQRNNEPQMLQILYFSGDDRSRGQPGTDYDNQTQLKQAAGDRFMVNGITTISPSQSLMSGVPSGIGPPLMPGGAGNFPTNLLSANQHRYHEIPSVGPAVMNPYVPPINIPPMDDMDALELLPFDETLDQQVHTTPIYFSLDPMSPALMTGPALYSPADILVSPPGIPQFQMYAPAPAMGLIPDADDIDALAVWDFGGEFEADPQLDYALFSLAPGSMSLFGQDGAPGTADDLSAADIFVTDFTGIHALFLPHRSIGMRFDDNVDAIDVEPEWMLQEPLDWVEPLNIFDADFDGDGDVDGEDFLLWQLGFPKPGGATKMDGDADGDGDVDGTDFLIWQAEFPSPGSGSAAGEGVPEPATVTLVALLACLALVARRRK